MGNPGLVVGIPATVLGHQGGWDEILLIVGPMAIVAGLLVLANRRVRRRQSDLGAERPDIETQRAQKGR